MEKEIISVEYKWFILQDPELMKVAIIGVSVVISLSIIFKFVVILRRNKKKNGK